MLVIVPAQSPRITVRRARIADVRKIKTLVDADAGRVLLEKDLVTLYEAVQEFWVAEAGDDVIGAAALHVLWEDIAELRTVVVDKAVRGQGVGHLLVTRLVDEARLLGLKRLFVLTFETRFFTAHGFVEIDGAPVPQEVYEQMRHSLDPGVAEFLDLPYVKPNTLGNSRMLLEL
jgi:amino-acid N-acetyltransferase